MPSWTCKEGRMASAVRSLLSRALDLRSRFGGGAAAGCISVYVGAGRERFVVPVERVNHRLFRRLLDDAELEYGYAARGPLALPGCDVGAFLDVLWQMEHDDGGDEDNDERIVPTAVLSSPERRQQGRRFGRYRKLSPTRSALRRRLL